MGTFRFEITGRVREAGSERPLPGLLVRAYDKDLLKDDFLGDASTDESGSFGIQFTDLAFRELGEQRPDVYLRIFDPTGAEELYSTASDVRRNARVREHFEIVVPAERVAAAGLAR